VPSSSSLPGLSSRLAVLEVRVSIQVLLSDLVLGVFSCLGKQLGPVDAAPGVLEPHYEGISKRDWLLGIKTVVGSCCGEYYDVAPDGLVENLVR